METNPNIQGTRWLSKPGGKSTGLTVNVSTHSYLPRFQIVPYSDFLLFSPERIAPTLRRFQENDDPERQVIVEAVLDVVQSDEPEQWEEHWETFMETGLHKIVVDILCEDKTYAPGVSEVCGPFYSLRHINLMLYMP